MLLTIWVSQQMNDKKKDLKSKVQQSVDSYSRKAMRYYFQDIAPVLGKYSGKITTSSRKDWFSLIPENIGFWLIVAILATIVVMLLAPERYWMVQPLIFIAIFLFGHLLLKGVIRAFFYIRNMLVAYPGKHLLGHKIKLASPLVDGEGEATLYGETWTLLGDDCEAGATVKVVAVENGNLFVEVEE